MRSKILRSAYLFGLVSLVACSGGHDDDPAAAPPPDPAPSYQAEITRTEYGIPHIVASDWGSLGYGHGYAFAQDNYCVLMEEVIKAEGRSLELLGEGAGNEATDFLYSYVNDNTGGQLEERYLSQQPEFVLQLVEGYAAGYNRYLRETGVENLPETDPNCRNAAWVRELTAVDIWKYFRRIQLQASTDQGIVRRAILDAAPPGGVAPSQAVPAAGDILPALEMADLEELGKAFVDTRRGSNAIALGGDATQSGTGMLLGNPHQPWYGEGSFYQVHLTIPGEYDAMGAALKGFPMIAIGFNQDVAWTHTVSVANRFSLFELQLNPDNPLQYELDGEMKDITPATVEITVTKEDGSTEQRQHTFYEWEYGVIVDLSSAAGDSLAPLIGGWPTTRGTVYALRDANLENLRGIEMWLRIGQSQSVADVADALSVIGNPLFHTLAADANGDMFYGEISAMPHVTQDKIDRCVTGVNQALKSFTNDAILALDGSTSDCQWGVDADAPPGSGLFGYDSLPKLFARSYAANSNDSYWLSNANQPLEGFPTVMGFIGHEGKQQNLRTHINHKMVLARLAGTDGFDPTPGFTLQTLQQLMYDNRVHAADIALDDVLALCDEERLDNPVPDADQQLAFRACEQLALWNRRVDNDSQGAQVFTEFWKAMESGGSGFSAGLEDQDVWLVDFDPAQPLTTPSGIDGSVEAVRTRVMEALAKATRELDAAGVALDAPWGQVQVLPRDGFDVPIHGGRGSMGVFGAISSGLGQGGYRSIGGGNSYIQTVTFDGSDCPVAEAIITTSQSINPASPHYSDQSLLYSNKEWVAMAYCEEDIEQARIGEPLLLDSADAD